MKRLGLVILLGLALIGTGCKQSDPMPGKWKLYVAGEGQAKAVIGGSAEFKADRTCEMHAFNGDFRWDFKGTYSVEGTTLKIDGEMNEKTPAAATEKSAKGSVNRPPADRQAKLVTSGSLSDDFKTFRIDGKDFQKE